MACFAQFKHIDHLFAAGMKLIYASDICEAEMLEVEDWHWHIVICAD